MSLINLLLELLNLLFTLLFSIAAIAALILIIVVIIAVRNALRTNEEKLYHAVRKGNTKLVKSLLKNKPIDVNKVTKYGENALVLASREGNDEIIRILKEKGAK